MKSRRCNGARRARHWRQLPTVIDAVIEPHTVGSFGARSQGQSGQLFLVQ